MKNKPKKKIWSYEESENKTLSEVIKLLKEYRDGLNTQQNYIKSDLDISLNENGNPIIDFRIDCSLRLFTVELYFDNYIQIDVHISDQSGSIGKYPIKCRFDEMEKNLDSFIANPITGAYLAHIIRSKKIRETQTENEL